MRLYRIICVCLWLPLWCAAVQSYTPVLGDAVLEPWRWRQDELLDDLHVLCMDETPDGTLWFGGIGLVARYDGMSVTEIPLGEALLPQLVSIQRVPRFWALRVLSNGDVLALAGQSLVVWQDGVWRVVLRDVGTADHSSRLKITEDGTIWLLATEALWRISPDLAECVKVVDAAERHQLRAFCLDVSGDLWLAEQTTWEKIQLVHQPLKDNRIGGDRQVVDMPFVYERGNVSLAARQDGKIVCAVGQRTTPLLIFSPEQGQWKELGESELMWSQYSLLEGYDGTVWIGHEGKISRLLPSGKLVEYPDLIFDLPQVPLVLFEASDKRLWVIGFNGQVCSVDTGFDEWNTYVGLSFEFETADGVEWFRADAQYSFSHDTRSGEWKRYGPKDHLPDRVRLLFGSSHGLVWVAGSHEDRAAFSVFDGNKWTRYRFPEFAESIRPNGAFEASDGTVWLGAQGRQLDSPEAGGALQFRVNADRSVELVKRYSPPEFPYYVSAFAEEPDGALWFGSTLIRRMQKDGTIQTVPELLGDNADSILLDHANSVWIAKENFGVCRWKDGEWTLFTRQDGLACLSLSDLQLLPDGSILAATSEGISRFDGSGWTPSVYPEWFNMSSRWSSIKVSSDGEVWLNYANGDRKMSRVVKGMGGSCAIRHRPESKSPETVIKNYSARILPPGNAHISWSGRDVHGQTLTENLTYSWRLNEKAWSPFSLQTAETFLNLKSGHYVLEVRARDQAFNVDSSPARVAFEVIPPVWRQPWFITLNSVLAGLIIWLIRLLIRTRERNLMERQQEQEAYLKKQQEEREHHLLAQQKQLIERQKEREDFLLKQQEEREEHLKELDRIKMGFFTNISHELRTPMTVIAGRLETIFGSETDDKRKTALSIVLRNAQRVSTLITQLLDFRKIEEGKITVNATDGDLAPLLRDWVDSLQVLAVQARISLLLDSMQTFRGMFDFDKLQKICTNLISNSIKYTDAGGEVRVVLRNEADDGGEPWLKLSVEDNGVGIPLEHLGHIFERFYRVSEATMAVGAGIGLNLTKELVDVLGGTIQVESPIHPDAARPGTRFTVRLPIEHVTAVRSQESVGEESGEPLCPLSPLCFSDEKTVDEEAPLILIVEDDEDIRNFIAEGLESIYRVVAAENGEAGLQLAKEQVPDLIVTDLMMPVVDGLTLCRELKTSLETSHVPVVMLTAKTSLESQIEGLKTGADDYVTKPFHMELLRVRIANLLESRRVLREKFGRDMLVPAAKIPENTLDKEFVDKALRVLEARYSEWTFKPDELAAALNMTVRTLQRKIKAVMNRTPADFMNEFRMMKAAERLRETSETVAEIAFFVGHDEPTHFSRQFKKYYQMSPSEYRSAHRPS